MDLKTRYMGFELRNPLVASSSPLTYEVDSVKKLEAAGISAVVMPSLFEEQILQEQNQIEKGLQQGVDSFAESLSYFPHYEDFLPTPTEYLEQISKIKKAVKIPVIVSLNGCTPGGWTSYAKNIEQAGADALELNLYNVPTDIKNSSMDVEKGYAEVLKAVKSSVKIPISVKLSSFFTSLPNAVAGFVTAGATGVVLFNRFYQPDIDPDTLEVKTDVSLSNSSSLRLPLRWVAILHGRVKTDLAVSSGIHEPLDVVKALLVGASATMLCSSLLKNGVEYPKKLEQGLIEWMTKHEYESVQQMIGTASQKKHENPEAFERAQYMKTLCSYNAK